MEVFSTCPRCYSDLLAGAQSCSCGWRSRTEVAQAAGPTMCCWNDHGVICRARGIISPSTNGSGPWYCREHWYKLRGYPDMDAEGLHGNGLPKKPLHSLAADQIRAKLKAVSSDKP